MPVRLRDSRSNRETVCLRLKLDGMANCSGLDLSCIASKPDASLYRNSESTNPKILAWLERRSGHGVRGGRFGKSTISLSPTNFNRQHVRPFGCSTSHK